jgi:hypothetical protein
MSEFHKSELGRKYYEKDMPSLILQMKRIADSLEEIVSTQKKQEIQEKKKEAVDRRKMIAEAIEIYERTRKKS